MTYQNKNVVAYGYVGGGRGGGGGDMQYVFIT